MRPPILRPLVWFDVMSTLVHDPIFDAAPAFFRTDARSLLRALDREAWIAFERGQIDEATWFATCFRDRRSVDGPSFRAAMAGGYRWLPGARALLTELRAAGVPMHLLSNYPAWYALVEAATGLSAFAPWTFVSCETGRRKPEAAAFLEPARALGVAPAEVIFVDDQPANVEAAAALGFQGVLFRGAAELRGELRALGVPLAAQAADMEVV